MDRAEYTNRIGILMNENDLSQDAFAASIGLNRDRVNNWLNGRSKLDVDSLKNISEKYNVSTDWVLGIAPIESRSPDVSIQGATAVTGLSEEAIHNIQVFKRKMKYGDIFSSDLSLLLESDKFIGIIPRIDELRFLYNKSADAVDYLLSYSENGEEDEEFNRATENLTEYFPYLRMTLFELSEAWSDCLESLIPTKELIADGKAMYKEYVTEAE